jgi:hypothetical protein
MLNVKKDRNIISGWALLRAKYTPIAGEMNIMVINIKELSRFFIIILVYIRLDCVLFLLPV